MLGPQIRQQRFAGAGSLGGLSKQGYLYQWSDQRSEDDFMPLQRFLNLSQEEQDRVYNVSKKQFAEHGYDAMSLNLLLKELEISKGQFYYWFEDKADLFLSILDQGIASLVSILEHHGSPPRPKDYWAHFRSGRLLVATYWDGQAYI